jgi:hypothetical protein
MHTSDHYNEELLLTLRDGKFFYHVRLKRESVLP